MPSSFTKILATKCIFVEVEKIYEPLFNDYVILTKRNPVLYKAVTITVEERISTQLLSQSGREIRLKNS